MAYHPTELTMLTENCPAALDMRERRVPYDRTLFAAGIAAHAVMEMAGIKVRELKRQLEPDEIAKIAAEVVKKHIGEGRSYDGKPEPPLNPEKVFEGRDMAVKYLNQNPLSTTGLCEIGFAYDKSWKSVDYYDESARFRTILDVLDVVRTRHSSEAGTGCDGVEIQILPGCRRDSTANCQPPHWRRVHERDLADRKRATDSQTVANRP